MREGDWGRLQGQVMLYNLMLSSVSGEEVGEGLLLYLRTANTFPVPLANAPALQGCSLTCLLF